MTRIAILVEDLYQVLEVWYPYLRLSEEDIDVNLIGTGKKNTYASKEGYPATVNLSITEITAETYDGVIIPGGFAPDILRRYTDITTFVKQMYEQKKIVAAICHGGWVLCSAGILKNKKATSFSAIKDDMINAGAEYLDQEVVVDENLVTSRNPYDLPAFTKEIINLLKTE